MSEPGPTIPEVAASRLEKVQRKSLSTDPRMPIRLDRAAWRRATPQSLEETQELVALRDEERRKDPGDVVEAAMKAMHAAPAPRLRRYRLRPERALPHAIIETRIDGPPLPSAPTASEPHAARVLPAAPATGAVPLTPDAAIALPAAAAAHLAPPSGRSTRLIILLLMLPWPPLWAGAGLLLALALGCHQVARAEAMDGLRATLLTLDRPTVLSDAQLTACQAALVRYRKLARDEDPDVMRWAMALQR